MSGPGMPRCVVPGQYGTRHIPMALIVSDAYDDERRICQAKLVVAIVYISGLNSAGFRVASATATHRRCADNGGDHLRPVAPQARRHRMCAAPPALHLGSHLGRKSSRAMTRAVFILDIDLRGAGPVCSLPARGTIVVSPA